MLSLLQSRGIPHKDLEEYKRDAERDAKLRIKQLIQPFDMNLNDPIIHVLEGSPKNLIPIFVKSQKIDLLVMGSLGRSGNPRVSYW